MHTALKRNHINKHSTVYVKEISQMNAEFYPLSIGARFVSGRFVKVKNRPVARYAFSARRNYGIYGGQHFKCIFDGKSMKNVQFRLIESIFFEFRHNLDM